MIALIEDRVGCLLVSILHVSFAKSVAKRDYLFGLNITPVAFTTTTMKSDSQVWKRIDRGTYSVILALPEILLGVRNYF